MNIKLLISLISMCTITVQAQIKMDLQKANNISALPFKCIDQEFPNKTAHVAESVIDAKLFPSELHPAFYGCFDWHSSVHGHWTLIRLLRLFPLLDNRDSIIAKLDRHFTKEKLLAEQAYFTKYELAKSFERTYGWAWLLKLDQELIEWDHPKAKEWHSHMQPLTEHIKNLWITYLPKQSYPNRTGVHPNTAFALCFAIDWARAAGEKAFEQELIYKAKYFYLNDQATPAYLEPDGTDFFSPSLNIADLMTRILPQKEFVAWIDRFYEKRSILRVCEVPIISDRMDYHISHLDGLLMSRAWNMKSITSHLPASHPLYKLFQATADKFLTEAYQNLNKGNYGGEHWLGSFMTYALTER